MPTVPRLRANPCAPGHLPKSNIALPVDPCPRYLQSTVPLPLPPSALTVHLELDALRKDAASRRVLAGAWKGLNADSMAAGQLLPYLKRCGIAPRRDARAITLTQPLQGRPDAARVVIFWGLLMAPRVVACLQKAMEGDGAKTSLLPAGGEPAFAADRAVSDLHLDAVALDASTLLVASGKSFRATVRRLIRGKGRSLAATPHYKRAARAATRRTLLLALAPRLPRRLPHVELPKDAHRYLRGTTFELSRVSRKDTASGKGRFRLIGDLEVGGKRRAARWAAKTPGKMRLLALLTPSGQRPLLTRIRATSHRSQLRFRLPLTPGDLGPFGRLVARWLPW